MIFLDISLSEFFEFRRELVSVRAHRFIEVGYEEFFLSWYTDGSEF